MPITKHNYIVKMSKLADTIRKAFRLQRRKTGPGSDRYSERCDSRKLQSMRHRKIQVYMRKSFRRRLESS